MNLYEHTIIARQDISPTQVKQIQEKYEKIIAKLKGNIVKTENWGLMQLSYLIKKNKKGNYIHFKIECDGPAISELEKSEKIDKNLYWPNYNSKLTHLNYLRSSGIANTFGRQVLSHSYSYMEVNPFSSVAPAYYTQTETINLAIEKLAEIENSSIHITNASATSLPYENNYFDAVITDPPYYDNIAYSYLSDFFYEDLHTSNENLNMFGISDESLHIFDENLNRFNIICKNTFKIFK